MDIHNEVSNLEKICDEKGYNSMHFEFMFKELSVRAIYFKESGNILIGVDTLNIAWYVTVNDFYNISIYIPTDKFKVILPYLDVISEEENKRSPKTFFEAMAKAMLSININSARSATGKQISGLLGKSGTTDKKYDETGDKPFFWRWRRNPVDERVGYKNIIKIRRIFGKDVADFCKKNNVSAQWKVYPTERSLEILTPLKSIKNIE